MNSEIVENIVRVRERIDAACKRAGRAAEDVRLIAVSKTVPADRIRQAFDAGLRDFGENRIQEAKAKRPALADLAVTWHLVGHLQTNKAAAARELFDWVHSVDSLRLGQKLASCGAAGDKRLPVLLEVNLGGEATKTGASEREVLEIAGQVGQLPSLEVCGLMTLPPFTEDPEGARPYFRRLREFAREIEARQFPGVAMRELSMGMSHDFEVAIEEGATVVRVGTAIFGARPQ